MFIGRYEINGEPHFAVYYKNEFGYKAWFEDTWSPEVENIMVLNLEIKGENYADKKDCLEGLAIDWQTNFSDLSWSYGELALIEDWFYTNAKRYGLLEEFRENGIC